MRWTNREQGSGFKVQGSKTKVPGSGWSRQRTRVFQLPGDNGLEDSRELEISRRIGEIDVGQAELAERDEFRERICSKLARKGI